MLNENTVNLKSPFFVVIMLLHEGLTFTNHFKQHCFHKQHVHTMFITHKAGELRNAKYIAV